MGKRTSQTNVTVGLLAGAIATVIFGVWAHYGDPPDGLAAPVTTILAALLGYLLPSDFGRRRGGGPGPGAAGLVILVLGAGASSCATVDRHNPVAVAETPEQHAYALYGTFVAMQEGALELVQDPGIPRSVRRAVQAAEGVAKPAADAVLAAAQAVERARARFQQGRVPEDYVEAALAELGRLIAEAQGPVRELTAAVREGLAQDPDARAPPPPSRHMRARSGRLHVAIQEVTRG